ncbi:MAG TPA: hypothetical protein VLT33_01650, partial [Labilithrix sp.]|nr:hypothetical protein [Labilithrix sp.]
APQAASPSAPPALDRVPPPLPAAPPVAVPRSPAPLAPASLSLAPPAHEPDPLQQESALLRSAHASLSGGDPAAALSLLDDHARRFPNGALSEDRAAARVHALCAQGRASDARAAASAFVAAHPRSALAPAVRRSCAETSETP